MILCCGEALIDMLPGTPGGQAGFVPVNGGAVFNTAIALARLGVSSGFMTGLSNDLFGKQLQDQLQNEGVDTSHCVRSNRPTTLAFVELSDGKASYTFYDENSAGRMVSRSDMPPVSDETKVAFFGGISLCNDPAASAYAALCEDLSKDRVVMIDPNVRAAFVSDRAAYVARIKQMITQADIVKLSDEDLAWFSEAPDLEAQIADVRGYFDGVLLITLGSEGAFADVDGTRRVSVAAPKTDVVDTVGAGDTFNAGFLAALDHAACLSQNDIKSLSDETLERALLSAVCAASLSVARQGANPPSRDELDARMQDVTA